MANVPLKSVKFPGLDDTYTVPQIDANLTASGKAADAKVTGDSFNEFVEVAATASSEKVHILVSPTSSTIDLATQDEVDELKSTLNTVENAFETTSQNVTEASHVGYRWDYNTGELVAAANYTAWEFDAEEYNLYTLFGLLVGTENSAAVLFIDSNGQVITSIRDTTQETGHSLPIETPRGCVKIKYSTYTNATWDKTAVHTFIIPLSYYESDYIPSYYYANDYIENKVANIIENAPLNGITFAFITDLHFRANQLHSLSLLKYVKKHTPLSIIISGGDYVQAYGSEDDIWYAYNKTLEYAKALYPDWFSIRGNHDFTIRTSSSASTGITWGDAITVNGIIRPMADWRYEVLTPEVPFLNESYHIYTNYNWVLTNEKEKVKIIYFADYDATNENTYWGVTSSHINAYLRYFYQMLKSTDGYKVVVVSHAPMTPSLSGGLNTNTKKVIGAFAAKTSITQGAYTFDFTQSTGELICALSGHAHRDQSILENGVLHIGTTCDALYQDDGYGRAAGTVDEQAFDVFNIDTENRTIKITRIGAGSDREFTY